jgi:branched-chain amino acid transport system ATP-binding protein
MSDHLPVLSVEGVCLKFDERDILRDVRFAVQRGELVGVVGGNGAGKTSLVNVITGYYTASQGQVKVDGKTLTGGARNATRMGVRRSFQSVAAFTGMSLLEFVLLGDEPLWRSTIPGAYFSTRRARREEARSRVAVRELLSSAQIKDVDEQMEKSSYGERKLADVLRAILGEGRIVLLDEPTSGLSSAEKHVVRDEILRRHNADAGVIIIDHDIAFVGSICDRMIGLVDGAVVVDGPVAEVLENEKMIASFIGKRSYADRKTTLRED